MSVQVSYKKQFAIYIIFLFIIVAAVEGIVRFYEYNFLKCPLTEYDAYKDVNYFHIRQICLDIRYLAFIEPDVVQIKPNQHFATIDINSHGFRAPETTVQKPENTYRIFTVGGSTTMGHGATSDETTWPGYLQKKFDDTNLKTNVEVINLGINGAYSFSEVYHIRKYLKFEPDLIIEFSGVNDAGKWVENPRVKTPEEIEEEYGGFKFKNYRWYRTPFMIFTIFFAEEYKERAFPTKTNPHDKVLAAWKDRWIDLCEETSEKGIKTVMIVQPSLGAGNKGILSPDEITHFPESDYDFELVRILDSMTGELDEVGQSCDYTADMRGIFDDVPEPIYWDKHHTADLGNEIIADEIYKLTLPIVLNDTKES